MSEIVHNANPSPALAPRPTVLVYYSGSMDAARAVAPPGRVRFANAKYWRGEIEHSGTVTRHDEAKRAVLFGTVFTAPGCAHADEIAAAYSEAGIQVVAIQPSVTAPPPVVVARAKPTATDLGWTLATPPDVYVKKYPRGARVAEARRIVAATK